LGSAHPGRPAGRGHRRLSRAQSDQIRIERSQRAEEAASEAPVKILLPMVIFIFPTIWIILAAPLLCEWLIK
jgi:tight adherence protein C